MVLPKMYKNCLKVKKKLFYETYFEESNINRKPFIWFYDKIITKFGPKNRRVWFWAKCTKTAPKIMEKCYFMKLTSKRVISTENILFSPMIS